MTRLSRGVLPLYACGEYGSTRIGCGECAEDPAEDRGPQPDGAVEHDLFTHCGVSAVDVGGDLYLRVGGKLGAGSSPPGWGDPFQKGWVVVEGSVATFTDGVGHHETFTPAPAGFEPERCL